MEKYKGKILIVDDDQDVLTTARILLKEKFESIITEANPQKIPGILRNEEIFVVILDMNFKPGLTDGAEGLFWLEKILGYDSNISVLMNTAYGDIQLAVEAMKLGASEFIVKPWDGEKLAATVQTAYNLSSSKRELKKLSETQEVLRSEIEKDYNQLVIKSEAMQPVFGIINKVANTDANVLILGENGTGKELVAREIHRKSDRPGAPFINVDMGAIPESLFESELFGIVKGAFTDAKEDKMGRFEVASGGTLFLDEIGNLPINLQSKLLSVIQNKSITRLGSSKSIAIDIRLICATNKNLHQMIEEGGFRQDLLYRINTVEISLPPVRNRTGDIPILAERFLEKFSKKYNKQYLKLTRSSLDALEKYSWPGNVRELQHVVERAVILAEGKELKKSDFGLKKESGKARMGELKIDELEKEAIARAISKNNGNLTKAAIELGFGRSTLYRKMKKYGI